MATAPVNVLMLVAATMVASAVFTAVAAGEDVPVVVGALLPWLVFLVVAFWWLGEAATRVRRHDRERAATIENARGVAVGLLLADVPQSRGRLESAAALLLDPEPTDNEVHRFLAAADEQHAEGPQPAQSINQPTI
jgi:hypothetical protein